jgi:hypothetical protein
MLFLMLFRDLRATSWLITVTTPGEPVGGRAPCAAAGQRTDFRFPIDSPIPRSITRLPDYPIDQRQFLGGGSMWMIASAISGYFVMTASFTW